MDYHLAHFYCSMKWPKTTKYEWHVVASSVAMSSCRHQHDTCCLLRVPRMLYGCWRHRYWCWRQQYGCWLIPMFTRLGWPNFDHKYLSIRNSVWRVVCVVGNLATCSSRWCHFNWVLRTLIFFSFSICWGHSELPGLLLRILSFP